MPKINATSLGKKTIATFKNFVNLTNFSRIAMKFRCINASLGEKFIATFTNFLSIQRNNYKLQIQVLQISRKVVYLANYVEILLHDHFSGCIDIANPLGLILSIPRGFAPWDEKMTPSGLAISMHPSK